jgi:hemolysin activation/secretion protein
MRATIFYDKTDNWQGYNIARTTLSHGISGLGSNSARDSNTSREDAKPDFTKLEIAVKRLQGITPEWSLLASGAAQLSSGSLYSSEEFGYGGQEFGRAFDPSEIVGDHGVAGSLELRYNGLNNSSSFNLRPYIFYDIGTVWNEGNAQISRLSAASTGGGIYITSDMDISANLALALPLIQDIETPIYGQNNKSPRLIFSISQSF